MTTTPTNLTFNFLDAPTGAGKTTAIIDKVKNEATISKRRFIVVVPYLGETDRISSATPCIIPKREPKTKDLQTLIQEGKNICCTHSLFNRQRKDTFKMIADSVYDYCLIIDEELEVIKVTGFNNRYEDDEKDLEDLKKYSTEDIYLIEKQGLIQIDPATNLITWNDKSTYSKGVFMPLKEYLETADVYIQGNSFIDTTKKDVFSVFHEITICSYRMQHSLLYAYCLLNNIGINWQHIENSKIVNGYKELKPAKLDKLHTYYPTKKDFNCTGSVSWYKTQEKTDNKEAFQYLTGSFRHFKENIVPKSCPSDYFWTVYKDFVSVITKDKNIGKRKHIACNTKATNKYSNCRIVGYFIQRHIHPDIYNFLHNKGISLDKNNYALSEAIQFIWRSNIRTDSDNDVYVFFASQELKTMFDYWKDN